MDNRIKSVTIVGGGTAGWVTAAVLSRFLNGAGDDEDVEITLIESPNVPTIGVGEATVPGMSDLLKQLGVDEAEYFRRCNASFKLGVRFINWHSDEDGKPGDFLHPFNSAPFIQGRNPAYHFNKFGLPENCNSVADALTPNPSLIRAFKGPRTADAGNFEFAINYAYHVDAALFSQFLREICVKRGVRHIRDDVVDVALNEEGFVDKIQLKELGAQPVEFVIDCTGFKGLIIQKALGEPFEPYDNYLLCDRALALQIPHQDPTRLEPCTRSTGLGAGWVWRVPLYSRLGTGYVYSSAFRSEEQAVDEFMAHLGDQAKGAEPRCLSMRVGRTRRPWVKNCIAIGLSSGFVEPLESTAIYMIEMSARWLVRHFPDKTHNPALARSFNSLMGRLQEEIRDFIMLHYYTGNRPDPFWVAARNDVDMSDSLKEKLELWHATLPGPTDTQDDKLFNYWNYLFLLYPKGFFKGISFPTEGLVTVRDWEDFQKQLNGIKAGLQHLPDHYELLTQIRAGNQMPGPMATRPQFRPPAQQPTVRQPH